MKTTKTILQLAMVAGLLSWVMTGCESSGGGGGSMSVGVYYGAGWYDPWYYNGYYDHGDIIVNPPPRPDAKPPGRPTQPIYRPSGPSARPMPSIPSAPRPAMRR